jgi:hypothetical protein
MYTCPVCGFDRLELPPANFSICACCGTEFGYDDRVLTHKQLMRIWIRRGFPWFDEAEERPDNWNPGEQLQRAGLDSWPAPAITQVHNVGTFALGLIENTDHTEMDCVAT